MVPKKRGPGSSTAASGGDRTRWLDGGWPSVFFDGGKPKQNGLFSYFSKGKVYIIIYPRYSMFFCLNPYFRTFAQFLWLHKTEMVFFVSFCVKGRVYFWKRRRSKSPKTFFLLHANKLFPFRKGFFPPKRTVYDLPRFFQLRDDLDFSQKMASTKLYYRHRQFSQKNYVQPAVFFFLFDALQEV